ncbi:hypothetical protein LJ128_003673 [Salmonella enterica]|uniref:Uncharacterized protein n=1 Tax=Salmonella enterica subsp. salamae serovar 47:b:1,5 TaxID=1967619 RepID=A0A701UHP1_SALER|nr:hypothetical protein [Salmonella enterica]ECI2307156.1 hypothetical protein [Salmonella enterica subsp. enterica serovar Infantis]EDN2303616.1 hypothetical protein [Salmonella enterica subsp. diarizonae serovar 65:(k):z]EDW4290070.1 hypothetical protein [Salmonella enterica subsp. diarizonae]EGO1766603.1 hypothetical protein [Salmonella enterica subsp. diarizonae serovar Rough:-:-]HAC6516351.1 hypothetical protein [Salmonella enterica subsp. salamae serovar 47:b:1,5]
MAEWKNNPLIVAVISGSAVLTTALFIVFTYVIPVYQKEDSNKISELQSKIDSKNELIKQITQDSNKTSAEKDSDLQTLGNFKNAEISKLKNELTTKNSELNDLQKFMQFQKLGALYQKGSYLPIGYDAIDIGASRDSIFKYYGAPRVILDQKYGYISIKYGYGGIDRIVYYLKDKKGNISNKGDVVSHIAVFKENEITIDEEKKKFLKNLSLKDFLINNLGYIEPCKNDYYSWHFPDKDVTVYYDNSEGNNYLIYDGSYAPADFDEECQFIHIK